MTLAEAILCGLLQGLAEFLPISSSGHLALAHALFGVGDVGYSLAFDVLLHFGTLFVVFVVYYKEIFALIPAFFGLMGKLFRGNFRFSSYSKDERFVILLIVATLPMALGIFVKDRIEWLASYPKIVGAVLILNGGMLLLSDYAARKSACRELTPRGACAVLSAGSADAGAFKVRLHDHGGTSLGAFPRGRCEIFFYSFDSCHSWREHSQYPRAFSRGDLPCGAFPLPCGNRRGSRGRLSCHQAFDLRV